MIPHTEKCLRESLEEDGSHLPESLRRRELTDALWSRGGPLPNANLSITLAVKCQLQTPHEWAEYTARGVASQMAQKSMGQSPIRLCASAACHALGTQS